MFNSALSASEIAAIYNAGSAGNCFTNIAPTTSGNNVTSTPTNEVKLTFSNVSQAGTTSAAPIAPVSAGALPSNYQITAQSVAYEISTSATFSNSITLSFDVPNVPDAATCSNLRMLHFNAATNQLENVTTGTNAYNSTTQVCTVAGSVTSLSPFVIAQVLAPTAASVTVGGRVLIAAGGGIRNALVTLTDASGNTCTARTGNRGSYRFENIAAGATYIISVKAKRFTFSQPTQIQTVNEDITEINFVADEDYLTGWQ